jgi:phosphatidylethanolamine/phosphatidyl-N-methylethanolamine N-methyltransferase
MAHSTISRAYTFYGRFYDIFEVFFRRRLAKALAPIPFRPGDRVLDIGVGTGFSLRHYPRGVHVTGIDNSPPMLEAARRKLRHNRVQAHVRLQLGDALHLPFDDRSFDGVLLSHVIATVADPHRCLAEALRVTREQGLLVLVNHFASAQPIMRWVERTFDPVCRHLGWRNDLSLAILLSRAGGRAKGPDEMTVGRGFLFHIIYLRKTPDGPHVVRIPLTPPVAMQPRLDPI